MRVYYYQTSGRLGGPAGNGIRPMGPLGRVATFAAGAVLVASALAVSLVVAGAAILVGSAAWGYMWWKTRALREQIARQVADATDRARMRNDPAGPGRVIDGEVVRDAGSPRAD